jgi:hypothetical protein
LRDFIDPLRYRLAISTRAGASDNDRDLNHMIYLVEDVLRFRAFVYHSGGCT